MTAAMGPPRWVDDASGLGEVVAAARSSPRYAVDTEFHRERSYFPKLALVQLAWDGGLALIDPLGVDVAPLADLLAGPGTAIMHASSQDLEVLELACGTVPSHLFDTQIAAGFLGMATPSLGVLVKRMLDVTLPKADRLSDWLHRPLGKDALEYAASDVEYLLALEERLRSDLEARGRLGWALDECELARVRAHGQRDPEEAWLKVKEARRLRGTSRAVAQSVAAWRERRAARLDQPVRHVLSDLSLVSIAQRPPATAEALANVRGLDSRAALGSVGREIMAAVDDGRALTEPPSVPPTNRLDGALRPAASLVAAWVTQLAHDLDLDPSLLATRADIEALLAGSPSSRLLEGWRAELVGDPVRRLVSGEAALAFDRGNGLLLEERSRRPLRW